MTDSFIFRHLFFEIDSTLGRFTSQRCIRTCSVWGPKSTSGIYQSVRISHPDWFRRRLIGAVSDILTDIMHQTLMIHEIKNISTTLVKGHQQAPHMPSMAKSHLLFSTRRYIVQWSSDDSFGSGSGEAKVPAETGDDSSSVTTWMTHTIDGEMSKYMEAQIASSWKQLLSDPWCISS